MAHGEGDAIPLVTAEPGIDLRRIPWIHELVECPYDHDPSMSMVGFAQIGELVDLIDIPGSQPTRTVARARHNPTLKVLRRWYRCFAVMHRGGYCLRGSFWLTNFRVYASQAVRMTGVHLFGFTQEGADLDYTEFVASVELVFEWTDAPMPEDIRRWLDLIARGRRGNEYLIRYNTALMEPRVALQFIMSARVILEQVRHRDPELFRRLMHQNAAFNNWNVDSHCRNSFMAQARHHMEVLQKSRLEPNLMGVLWLGRNCWQHPARDLELFLILIMEDDFSELADRVQKTLFYAGLLTILSSYLEASMD